MDFKERILELRENRVAIFEQYREALNNIEILKTRSTFLRDEGMSIDGAIEELIKITSKFPSGTLEDKKDDSISKS